MNIPRFLIAAFLANSSAGFLLAQPIPYPGTKSNFTISVTATSEVGGFVVKESALEAHEAKGISFHSVAEPLGYVHNELDPAHYYSVKESQKSKTFGTGEDAETLTTESVVEDMTKLVSQKFTNANFIEALIERELVDIPGPQGYKLVVVQPQVRLDNYYDEPPLLFFIENGTDIHYVGRQAGEPAFSGDALVLDFYDGVEAYNYKSRRVYAHRTETEIVDGTSNTIVIEDEVGTRTVSDAFSGRSLVRLAIFGSRYDDEEEEYIGNGGVGFYLSGEVKYAGRYDAKAGLYLTTNASLSGGVGNFYDVDADSDEGLASASFSLSGTKKIDDIMPYLNELPSELAELKAEIIAGYSVE